MAHFDNDRIFFPYLFKLRRIYSTIFKWSCLATICRAESLSKKNPRKIWSPAQQYFCLVLSVFQELRKMLDLMVHASQCCSSQCQYPNCRKVKGLFRHGTQCKIRASGGCPHCKKMWYLIQLHGRACKESKCRVPHCKDLKEHFRRLQQQMESRRRAAVMEMMRQRAEDASSKCS